MQQKIFSIRDSKGEYYSPPFYKNTEGEATRDFKALTLDTQSTVNKFPEDYDLYCIGTFDNLDGKIQAFDTPKHIVKAANLIS